ncbi:hypothetical protein F5Y17DRAFT_452809 [Xylariaceae sp. FL0594]|nr:hypothetical protein F5Y17DRAFT_452809 [Xylariaceae sp. FL0594]
MSNLEQHFCLSCNNHPEFGTFQDGGVLRNNPTIVGLSEFSALADDTQSRLDHQSRNGIGSRAR